MVVRVQNVHLRHNNEVIDKKVRYRGKIHGFYGNPRGGGGFYHLIVSVTIFTMFTI